MKRVQRSRKKGWKMPPNTIYVGRPTIHGNPFTIGMLANFTENASLSVRIKDRSQAVRLHREMLLDIRTNDPKYFEELIAPLRGKNLACWCKLSDECHADNWLELAGSHPQEEG